MAGWNTERFEKGLGKGKGKDLGAPFEKKKPWEVEDMSLGVLKNLKHPSFEALEWHFRVQLHELSTTLWGIIQGGRDEEALGVWKDVWILLELDAASWMDMMILAHQGPPGRSEANKILWEVLTKLACQRDFKNLSRKISSLVGASRRLIDRPPDGHRDLEGWTSKKALFPRYPEFSHTRVPREPRVVTGPRGVPLAPPQCFGAPPPPAPAPQQVPAWAGSSASASAGSAAPPPASAGASRGGFQWRR